MFSREYFNRFPDLRSADSSTSAPPNVIFYDGTHEQEQQKQKQQNQEEELRHLRRNIAALLAQAMAEQHQRRQEIDTIQRRAYMEELERRRLISDGELSRRRELEIADKQRKEQMIYDHISRRNQEGVMKMRNASASLRPKIERPLYHGRIIKGPDGHHYKMIFHQHDKSDLDTLGPSLSSRRTLPVVVQRDYTGDLPFTTLNPQSSSLERSPLKYEQIIFDSDDMDDKAKFVHVDPNLDMNHLDDDIASDASVCQGRSSDDSISTHTDNIFHPSSSPQVFVPSAKPSKAVMGASTDPPCTNETRQKSLCRSHEKLYSNCTAPQHIKIVQGMDGRLYKVLEELDAQGKNDKEATQFNANESTPYVLHELKQEPHLKQKSMNTETDHLPFLIDLHQQNPSLNHILEALFDSSTHDSIPSFSPFRQSEKTSQPDKSSLQSQTRKASLQTKKTDSEISEYESKKNIRIVRGPDGRLYRLTVDRHKNDDNSSLPFVSEDEVLDSRGEPEYHHVRGPYGHLYKVKNVHYHESYPDPFQQKDDDTNDGEKTPKHDNKEEAESQKDRARKEDVTFYSKVQENDTFQLPMPVTDHILEMSSPYEFVEGKDGVLHQVKPEVQLNISPEAFEARKDTVKRDVSNEIKSFTSKDDSRNPAAEVVVDISMNQEHDQEFISTPDDDHLGIVEDASDSENEDDLDLKDYNLGLMRGEWLEPASEIELHKTEILRSHNQ